MVHMVCLQGRMQAVGLQHFQLMELFWKRSMMIWVTWTQCRFACFTIFWEFIGCARVNKLNWFPILTLPPSGLTQGILSCDQIYIIWLQDQGVWWEMGVARQRTGNLTTEKGKISNVDIPWLIRMWWIRTSIYLIFKFKILLQRNR